MKAEQIKTELLKKADVAINEALGEITEQVHELKTLRDIIYKNIEEVYLEARFYEYIHTPCSKYKVPNTSL